MIAQTDSGRNGRYRLAAARSPMRVAIALLVAAALPGCGNSGPQVAQVEGTVTLDDQPLTEAFVYFRHEQGGRIARAVTDENGHYSLNFSLSQAGAIVGKNAVRISTFVEPHYTDEGKLIPGTGRKELVPEKYRQEGALEAVVEPRHNQIDFALKSNE